MNADQATRSRRYAAWRFRLYIAAWSILAPILFLLTYLTGKMLLPANGALPLLIAAVAAVAAIGAFTAAISAQNHMDRQSSEMRDDPPRALRVFAGILPPDARAEHLEEWHAWLLDLRRRGVSRWRLRREFVSIVLAVPRLAVTAWEGRRTTR